MKKFLPILAILLSALAVPVFGQVPKIRAEKWLTDLETPVWLTHDPANRLIVVEQRGRVRLIVDGKMQEKPYLDIVSKVRYQGEMGLLSCIFHPKFAENGYIYVNYTRQLRPPTPASAPTVLPGGRRGRAPQGQIQTVIAEYHVDPKATEVDPATERIIMTIDQPYSNHNGGQLLFGPHDGMLYIGMGDGGAANDPQNRAQNMQELLGKVLRIDVSPREGYAVPRDNPFVGQSNARPEIWALGLRNPWRMSFDRQPPHLLYAGDVGQNLWEMVFIIRKGGNYGWNVMEGTHPFKPMNNPPEFIPPIKEYHHSVGLSITGGFVYRGKKIPSLVGWYLYADYAKGQVWGLKYENGKVTGDEQLLQMTGQISSFGEDLDGELYICDHGPGIVHKILPAE